MAKQARRKAQQRKKNNNLWIWGVVVLVILAISAVWLTSRDTSEPSSYPREVSVDPRHQVRRLQGERNVVDEVNQGAHARQGEQDGHAH